MRIAVIPAGPNRRTVEEVQAYLPRNYKAMEVGSGEIVIAGEDNAGWTLDGYVIPRLGSGLIFAKEVGNDGQA